MYLVYVRNELYSLQTVLARLKDFFWIAPLDVNFKSSLMSHNTEAQNCLRPGPDSPELYNDTLAC